MKKTFRRAIACLLAVLMVVFSFPFTALAETATGWWGDNEFNGAKNPNVPYGEQEYNGLNSEDYDFGFSWGDSVDMAEDLDMAEDALYLTTDVYKPTLTVTVSNQGTADNRIYRQYYGYSTDFDYDTVYNAGNIMNPADLHAGDRIAVTVEIGGFDMIYSGQLKGKYDGNYLATAYYKLNPKSKDQWAICSETQTTQAMLTRGYAFYGTAVNDGSGSYCTDNVLCGFYTPFTGNATPYQSSYVGADQRTFGKNGMVITVLSFEVLQDCDLSDVLWFDQDIQNSPDAYAVTRFRAYAPEVVGTERNIYTFDTKDEKYTCQLIALAWSNYSADDSSETETTYTVTFENAAGEVVSEKTYAEGTAAADVEIPDNTAATVGTNGHYTYSWPDVDDVSANVTYKEVKSDLASHSGTLVSTVKETTCGADGEYVYKCSACGEQYTVYPSATGNHTPVVDNNTAVTATCKTDGKEADTVCQVCGETLSTGATISKTTVAHTPISANNGVAATCKEDGKEADTICEVCGETITVGATISKDTVDHTPISADNAVKATCKEDGKEADTICAVCGETIAVGATISKDTVDHTPVSADNAVPATCKEDGKEADTICSVCGETITVGATISKETVAHTPVSANNAVPATCTTDGKEADTICEVCGETIATGAKIDATGHAYGEWVTVDEPTYTATGTAQRVCANDASHVETKTLEKLDGVAITVVPSDIGSVSLNGDAIDEETTTYVGRNANITLTAAAVDGANFVGWEVNGKIVSADAEFTTKAVANVTYTAVYALADTTFTVVFTDAYGNVIYTQDVTSGADITVPAVPAIAGYTATGWSLTDEEIAALTESATITAVYEVQETGFKVVANGATITTADASAEDALENVPFDTYTTVTAAGATGWKIGDTVVGFGESYSFYVGSDITLTAVFEDVVDAPSSVTAISVSPIGATGAVKASFLATRTIADADTYVTSGYIYTASADATLDLASVDGKNVAASYCSTDSEQFILNIGRISQTGTISARAFLVYVDGEGVTQITYADVQTFTY
jgi:hypothetical protein